MGHPYAKTVWIGPLWERRRRHWSPWSGIFCVVREKPWRWRNPARGEGWRKKLREFPAVRTISGEAPSPTPTPRNRRCWGSKNGPSIDTGRSRNKRPREMADHLRRKAQTDFALSITGVAGPSGGTIEKPVGTNLYRVSSARGTQVWEKHLVGDRALIRSQSILWALNHLRQALIAGRGKRKR
jgi:hypothetical protein